MREREQAKDEALNTFVKYSVVEVAARHGISTVCSDESALGCNTGRWWSIEGTVGGARSCCPKACHHLQPHPVGLVRCY